MGSIIVDFFSLQGISSPTRTFVAGLNFVVIS